MKLTAQEFTDVLLLYAAYNLASDSGTAGDYARCFTPTGELVVGKRVTRGRAELTKYKVADQARRTRQYRRHWNTNIHLQKVGPGRAIGSCYLLAFQGKPGTQPTITHVGVYTDELIKVHGQWHFAKRELKVDYEL